MSTMISTLGLGLIAAFCVLPVCAQTVQSDPYVWLEKLDSPQATEWVKAENGKTLGVLEKDPHFAGFYAQALAIAEAKDRIPMPNQLEGKIVNFWQDSDHVKGLWRATSIKSYRSAQPVWSTLLNLDALAKQEKANWVWKGADCEELDQHRCMLSLSDGGEDAVTLREFDLGTSRFISDGFKIPKGKSRVAWQDKNTLLLAREWKTGELTTSGYPYVIKRLKRGQRLTAAQEIFRGKPDDGGYGVQPLVLHDGSGSTAVIIQRPLSTFEFEHYLVTDRGVQKLALPAKVEIVGLSKGQLIIKLAQDWLQDKTTFPQGALLSLDLKAVQRQPDQLAATLIYAPTSRESVEQIAATHNGLVVETLNNVRGRITLYSLQNDGSWTGRNVAVPDNSAVSIVSADYRSSTVYLNVTGFLQPPSLWQLDTAQSSVEKIKEVSPKFASDQLSVQQFEVSSSDGIKIPYFVVGPKDLKLDGKNPTILNAYGGFQVSNTPRYAGVMGKLWLEQGGVFVLANIRGGGEFGPAWHEAGLKTKRQIIYDDFAAVGRDLIARKITSPRHLGIQGGSNGGLLMGVEMTQHPELWNAVDIQVPLLDMLRFESIAAGVSWVGEYGSVSVPAEKNFLASISPYNNLKKGKAYPEALVWTTTKDDRVGPQHARKFAARLSEFGAPYFFYEVTEGGHGAGANLKETAHTNALELTYFTRKLMMP